MMKTFGNGFESENYNLCVESDSIVLEWLYFYGLEMKAIKKLPKGAFYPHTVVSRA
ncbi:hypothetical protein [uncultured Dialister sp.]|jgi:hypothetical protein|uniref:hypothetical protein n=1 Tax=uncultured Dialister sp. TaxID=278064 RepID=UPI0025F84265|nr:hypothetical protein [uncultured Dialister sp.]